MSLGSGNFSFIDYDGEVATISFTTGVVTAGNLAGVLSQFGALRSAIEGIVLGTTKSESLSVFNTNLSQDLPADENAQRERKWLVSYTDDTAYFDAPTNSIPNAGYGKRFVMEIPTANYDGKLLPNTDIADLADPAIAAFVTAFETLVKTTYGGLAKVLRITAVGRRG